MSSENGAVEFQGLKLKSASQWQLCEAAIECGVKAWPMASVDAPWAKLPQLPDTRIGWLGPIEPNRRVVVNIIRCNRFAMNLSARDYLRAP